MNVLAFDTSTDILTIELTAGSHRLYEVMDYGMRHQETLAAGISRLLSEEGLRAADLDLIACGRGPGSFTGLRIGMATAKGLAGGLDIPFVTVPTLDIFACGLDFFPGVIVSVVDARKHRLYAALYRGGVKTTPDLDMTAEDLLSLVKAEEQILFTGPNADIVFEKVRHETGRFLFPLFRRGNPGGISTLAREIFRTEGPAATDTHPVYLRKSEAEISSDHAERGT